ncbi:hypothetical protein G6L37_34730 [Agrobacterium rubi]|nr:hypothetical protein [Agrobacterium rubi]NTF23724.1 hypothetical protein [Agrobacterium rubi]
MILPTKYLPAERSLIHVGGEVLVILRDGALTVSDTWGRMQMKDHRYSLSFDWFTLTLALLYAMGLVELEDDLLVLRKQ